MEPLGTDLAYGANEARPFHDGQPTDPDHARHLQTGKSKIGVGVPQDLVEAAHSLMEPRRHHTYKPVVVRAGRFAHQYDGAELARREIGSGKP